MRRGAELPAGPEQRHREWDTEGQALPEQTAGDGKVKESKNRSKT